MALRELFISAAKVKFIFYSKKTKQKQHTLCGLKNKNAPKLFILCLNSSCADYDYNAYGSPNLVHYNL